jgi:protoporphyrinogen oxidase
MPHTLILGGGISGLTAGWKLAEAKIPVTILESESHWGGLAGSIRQNGYVLDFGPHSFFSEDEEIAKTVSGLMGPDSFKPVARKVKLYYRGRYLDYPFTALTILSQMGFMECVKTLVSYLTHRLTKKREAEASEDISVEEWALSNFGPHLYKVFFKPYTEQFWEMPCTELSARTIPSHTRLSFLKTLKHLLHRRLSKKVRMQLEREKLPTRYPDRGYGEIAERIAEKFTGAGGELKNQSTVKQIRSGNDSFTVEFEKNGCKESKEADMIISTLPLPVLIKLIEPSAPPVVCLAAQELEYRPIVFLGIAVKRTAVLDASYVYTLNRPYNRITDMSRFSKQTSPEGQSLIGVEIPCRYGDETWNKTPELLFEDCIGSLEKDGILKREEVVSLMLVKSRYAYPIYKKNYAPALKTVLDYIHSIPNLYTLGRSGEFMYMDADQCMRRAFDLAHQLLQPWGGLFAASAAAR